MRLTDARLRHALDGAVPTAETKTRSEPADGEELSGLVGAEPPTINVSDTVELESYVKSNVEVPEGRWYPMKIDPPPLNTTGVVSV